MSRSIASIAYDIRSDWGSKVNYAAKPYLNAMLYLNNIDDKFMFDDARSVVRYFLSNASSYRGETAKKLKAELKSIVGIK